MLRVIVLGFGLALVCLCEWNSPAQDKVSPKKDTTPTPEGIRFFETKVRPVLAENCFKCHGPTKQSGDLRVDSRGGLLAGGDSGPALAPGDAEQSLFIKAIRHVDPNLKMPRGNKLSAEQIADLTVWVKMGAPWPAGDGENIAASAKKGEMLVSDKDRSHWAFKPVTRPTQPPVQNQAWVKNAIDAFVLAQLEVKGLRPNPPASRQELVRRLFFDLTGLPPTPKDVDDFVNDRSPTAYATLVEKLLESPGYGEKWARHWLDLVRYAETNSYERDNPKPNVWRYRDYVIRAFNQDKPFDRFIREQLAGDEMPNGDAQAKIATGYYRLGIWDDEPSDPLLSRYDALDDIVATTSQVFLGLTVDCARCHDHKIDPISQKDYYRMMAFFHNINHFRNGGPTDETPIFSSNAAKIEYERQVKELQVDRDQKQLAVLAIENEFRANSSKQSAEVGQRDLDDLEYRYYRDSWQKLPDFAALKPETVGKVSSQRFDIGLRTRDTAFGFVFEGVLVVPSAGKYTFYLDSDDGSRLMIAGKIALEYDGIHGTGKEKSALVDLPAGRLPIKLEYFQNQNGLGLYVAWSGPGFSRRLLSATEAFGGIEQSQKDIAKLIGSEGSKVLGKEKTQQYSRLRKELEALKKKQPVADMALWVTEPGPSAPETFVLIRGNPTNKGAKVEPGFPQVLTSATPNIRSPSSGSATSGRRLALANWLASRDNPLTGRVMVNRIWQYHFGRGIVRSPNNFGTQGDKPTHPELLDWLASEFMARGWSMKEMHRLILTSNSYQMSSKGQTAGLKADPANDWFWRFDMRRLSGEEIRDSILAVSGLLNRKMYGPGVYPEIPKEVLAGQSVPGKGWGKSSAAEQSRRSIYVHVKRSLLLPILDAFDLAETDRSTAVRFASTQPTQALLLLNSDFLNKQAAIFAKRLLNEAGPKTEDQVELGLRLATGRVPTAGEVERGTRLIAALQVSDGPYAALKYFCLMVFNLNEFMYLD
jgi:mono/diheme cytochrome c family protein